MSEKRRPKEEFETFMKSLFERDSPKVKYQNPDCWRITPQVKKKKTIIKPKHPVTLFTRRRLESTFTKTLF